MVKIHDVFKGFSGKWRFKRVVKTLSSGEVLAFMVGNAQFTLNRENENVFHYKEEGYLTTNFQKKLQTYCSRHGSILNI